MYFMKRTVLIVLIILTISFIAVTPNVVASSDCSTVIETIKQEHWDSVKKKDMSWYGAGLILGLYYVEKDCNNSKEKMEEILDNLWTAQKEYEVDRKIVDGVSAGIRFVAKQL